MRALVRACLRQGRAISEVEAQVASASCCGPSSRSPGQQVLARCRDASGERRRARGQPGRRLYRLITENTTDLISRHSPDGRFLDATPAAFRLLGVWPEQLRGIRHAACCTRASAVRRCCRPVRRWRRTVTTR
jgi:PAS domain-containing protein